MTVNTAQNKRPLTVTIIAWLYIVTGLGGFGLHAREIKTLHPFPYDALWPVGLGIMAVVAGIYMLKRANWARWLAVVWIAFHVGVSLFHTRQELILHSVLLVVIAYLLFRPEATRYFRATRAKTEGA
jgi:hypothetical protein